MDMALADLFKHKIRFELVGEDPDYEEIHFYSVGRQYSSRKIENKESIGVSDWVDLCLCRLQEFFIYVVSKTMHECPFYPIDYLEIKAKLRQEETHGLIGCVLDNPRANISLFTKCSMLTYYGFPDDWWDEPFYIDKEAYAYISLEAYRKLTNWDILGL